MAYVGLATIKASGDIDYEELEAYDEQLQCLISTVEGTLPGSRGFGLDPDIKDKTPDDALNLFAMDLQEKVEKFIPGIGIANVSGKMNDSSLETQIYIERRDTE